MYIVTLAGSPKSVSRSSSLLRYVGQRLHSEQVQIKSYSLSDFDQTALLHGDFNHPSIKAFQDDVERANGLVIATPVYKASISGVLKSILDVLGQDALAHKVILPLASGGSVAHLLALDYALKPVLSAMKAQEILTGVFAQDQQIQVDEHNVVLDSGLKERLDLAVGQFQYVLRCRRLAGYGNQGALNTSEIIYQ